MTIEEAYTLIESKAKQILADNTYFSRFAIENGVWNFEIKEDYQTPTTLFPAEYKVGEWDYACRYDFRDALSPIYALLAEWVPKFKTANLNMSVSL